MFFAGFNAVGWSLLALLGMSLNLFVGTFFYRGKGGK